MFFLPFFKGMEIRGNIILISKLGFSRDALFILINNKKTLFFSDE